jgi:hypothetical protein
MSDRYVSIMKLANLVGVLFLMFWVSDFGDPWGQVKEFAIVCGVVWYGISLRLIGCKGDTIRWM